MSKSSPRLGRPALLGGGGRTCASGKELQGQRSCMLRIGERLMRAGSEGSLLRGPSPPGGGSWGWERHGDKVGPPRAQGKGPASSTESPLVKNQRAEDRLGDEGGLRAATLPRGYAGGGGLDGEPESRPSRYTKAGKEEEDAFLDELRRKYPQQAPVVLGHRERLREQLKKPRASESATCQREEMSDGELNNTMAVPFARGCKGRSSLPIGRSSAAAREPLGVLYLQYGEETKQVRMPAEILSEETLRALFVGAFPQQLSMQKLRSPNVAVYIKDTRRNVYFDLEDIRNITSHSCLKLYHKDASLVFQRHARPTDADTNTKLTKEVLYGSHSPVHRLSPSPRGTLQSLRGSASPPTVRSMPSSPSRVAYGGGRSARASAGSVDAVDAAAAPPRERLMGVGGSAILERRDVKPDQESGSRKSVALLPHGDGGGAQRYADAASSSSSPQEREGSFALGSASSRCSAASSHPGDAADGGPGGIPGGLKQYRASVQPLAGYLEQRTQSLHRQRNRTYGDSQVPQFGSPPPSPQVRLKEGQIIGGVGLVRPERTAPARASPNGEVTDRRRGSASSSSLSSVFADGPPGPAENLLWAHVSAFDAQSQRMKEMEGQIASLAGLVHHALSFRDDVSKGPGSEGARENHPVVRECSASRATAGSTDGELGRRLARLKSNVVELRLQLKQLRHLQIAQQESVSGMLRTAGRELLPPPSAASDRPTGPEGRPRGPRDRLEEDRILYLAAEEKILGQLSELEDYVDGLNSGPSPITLTDVEEGAVNLRRVGETLAVLKGDFPQLQAKMHSVLRLEVDSLRFLKEEPHQMDAMLKRVKALTQALSSLRRCVSESTPSPPRPARAESPKAPPERDRQPPVGGSPPASPKAPPRSRVSSASSTRPEPDRVAPPSPAVARRSGAGIEAPRHGPPLNPTHARDLPTVAKVSPRSREGSPAPQTPPSLAPLHSRELHRSGVPEKTREDHIETCSQAVALVSIKKIKMKKMTLTLPKNEEEGRRSHEGGDRSPPRMAPQRSREAAPRPTTSVPDPEPPSHPAPGSGWQLTTEAETSPSPKPVRRMEKPRRSSLEKKQSPDRSVPARMPVASPGQIDPAKAPEVGETDGKAALGRQGVGEERAAAVPQRQAPDVKGEGQTSATATAVSESKDDGEDDKSRLTEEMQQVTIGATCAVKLPVGQQKRKEILPIGDSPTLPLGFSNRLTLNQEILHSPNTDQNKSSSMTSLPEDPSRGIVAPDRKAQNGAERTPKDKFHRMDQNVEDESPLCGEKDFPGEEEGGSLSPDILDDRGPPPPPLVSRRIARQISKMRVKSDERERQKTSRETAEKAVRPPGDDPALWDGADGGGRLIPIFSESDGSESDLNRLWTIFEYDEDLERDGVPLEAVSEEKRAESHHVTLNLHVSENRPDAEASSPDKNGKDMSKADFKKAGAGRTFKFKFPKSKFWAFGKALRSGAPKMAEKSLADQTATSDGGADEVAEKQNESKSRIPDEERLREAKEGRREGSPSKRPASHINKNFNSPQSKRVKAQLPAIVVKSSPKKQIGGSSTQRPHGRFRRSSGSPEKTGKEVKRPSCHKPPGQDGGGDGAAVASRAWRASKIPALRPSCGKAPCSACPDSLQTTFFSSSSTCGKHSLLSPPSPTTSRLSPPPPTARKPALSDPQELCTPSPPPPPRKSLGPSLNLHRLLPSPASPVCGEGRRRGRPGAAVSQLASYSSSSSSYSSSSASSSPASVSPTSPSPFIHPAPTASGGGSKVN
ncbi:uncharacterized protein LOC144085812 [Stigmatopora argus]